MADLNRPKGESLAERLGDRARFLETDVTSESSVQTAVQAAVEWKGQLSAAVHCAGLVAAGRVLGHDGPHDLGLFSKVVGVNLIGTFNVVRLAAAAISLCPPDADGERGVLITTSSVSAFDGQMGQAAYAASKAAVAGMTLPLARDLARHGIRVMCIAPGVFETPLMESLPAEVRESLARQIPFPPRFGRPEEFAALVEHILTNTMLNGEVIRLDGALRMAAK
jgi:NAD(P)-dependent dehydrogenase (short-subunit alcohol dehydrogenase family)